VEGAVGEPAWGGSGLFLFLLGIFFARASRARSSSRARGDFPAAARYRGGDLCFRRVIASFFPYSPSLVSDLGSALRGEAPRARFSVSLFLRTDLVRARISAAERVACRDSGGRVSAFRYPARAHDPNGGASARSIGGDLSGPTRYRATLAYVGTDFHGWQVQANASRTVHAALEKALGQLARAASRPVAAGRTDAGVHADGQVVHFDLPRGEDPARVRSAVNGLLPWDVRLIEAAPAPPDFHARRDAVWKE